MLSASLSKTFPFLSFLLLGIRWKWFCWIDCIKTLLHLVEFVTCDYVLEFQTLWCSSAVLMDNSRCTWKRISILMLLSVPSWRANDSACRACSGHVWLSPLICCIRPISSVIKAEGVGINSATPAFWMTAFPNLTFAEIHQVLPKPKE